MCINWSPPPFGLSDLEENAAERYSTLASNPLIDGGRVRCCIRGCREWLLKRQRGKVGVNCFCPKHGLSVYTSPT